MLVFFPCPQKRMGVCLPAECLNEEHAQSMNSPTAKAPLCAWDQHRNTFSRQKERKKERKERKKNLGGRERDSQDRIKLSCCSILAVLRRYVFSEMKTYERFNIIVFRTWSVISVLD